MTKAINRLIEDIPKRRFPADKIILFGSTVRNRLNEYSDLDICILCEKNLSAKQMNGIERYFYNTLKDEMPVDFIYCNADRLKRGTQIYESIRKEGLVLYE
jgi:predicted nucleotidyltransferase